MLLRLKLFYLFLFLKLYIYGIEPPSNNAVATSLGGANVTYNNAYSIVNNPAGLAFAQNAISINGSNYYGISDYSTLNLSFCKAVKTTQIGFSFQSSPLASQNKHQLHLALSKKISKNISAGVGLNYHNFTNEDSYYKPSHSLSISTGLYYQINSKINIGFAAKNFVRNTLIELPQEKIASEFRIGGDYLVSDGLKIYSDFIQREDSPLDFAAGIELKQDKFFFRGGFSKESTIALGMGYKTAQYLIYFGATYHNQLGISPSLGLDYAF